MAPDSASPPRLAAAEWLIRSQTRAVFEAIRAGGYEARAVGGVVRNTLLDLPATDVDIATSAPPEKVMQLAQAAGLKAIPTGVQHGTVTVVADHIPYEVTTLREDVETFGRHATVAFTDDWAADARRRDFTINALYCDIDGKVHDPLGGYPDLLARRVRFIGDPRARIREDYLRILRFFRITATYAEGQPDPEGLVAAVLERDGLARLSGERVHQELTRLLIAPRGIAALESMRDHGLLTAVLPLAPRLELTRKLADIETRLDLKPNSALRLAALCVEIIEDAQRLRERLKLSTAEFDILKSAAEAPPELRPGVDEQAAKAWLYRLGAEKFRTLLLVGWTRSARAADDADALALLNLPKRWQAPNFPLSGTDILAAGIPAGPQVGNILRQLEDWWIAAGFPTDHASLKTELTKRIHR